MVRFERRCCMSGLLHFRSCISTLFCLSMLLAPTAGESDMMGQIGHFPMTSGSSWTYATTALTLNNTGQQEMLPAGEDVTVAGNGVFHSAITFSNGNTTTSDNLYFLGDALYVAQTHIVMFTKFTTPIGDFTTTTTTDNSYSPPQEYFPSEPYPGNVETSSGQGNTNITTVSTTPYGSGSSSTSNTSTQNVRISVDGSEPVTVGAGTFPSALKLSVTITVTEGGQTTPYDYTAWYAEGVGLVKFTSQNMNRELVSYAVNPAEPSLVEIEGQAGSFSSLQAAMDAAGNGDILRLRASDYQENPAPVLDRPVNLVLAGGLSSDYSTVIGRTYLQGPLTVLDGSLDVSNLAIY